MGAFDIHLCRPFEEIILVLGESDGSTLERITSPGPGMLSVMLALSGDFTVLGESSSEWHIPVNTAAVMFRPSDAVFDVVARNGARMMVLTVHIGLPALAHEPLRSGLQCIAELVRPLDQHGRLLTAMPISRELRSLALEAGTLCQGAMADQPLQQAIRTLALLESVADACRHEGAVALPIPGKGDLEKLFRVKAFIDNNFASPVRMAEVAHEFSLSPSKLAQAFQAAFGLSPLAYLNQIRVERAIKLLHGTDATIGQISWAVGYTHQGNFTVAFKRATGMSPRRFRLTEPSARQALPSENATNFARNATISALFKSPIS